LKKEAIERWWMTFCAQAAQSRRQHLDWRHPAAKRAILKIYNCPFPFPCGNLLSKIAESMKTSSKAMLVTPVRRRPRGASHSSAASSVGSRGSASSSRGRGSIPRAAKKPRLGGEGVADEDGGNEEESELDEGVGKGKVGRKRPRSLSAKSPRGGEGHPVNFTCILPHQPETLPVQGRFQIAQEQLPPRRAGK
jgi:hypothetical protein